MTSSNVDSELMALIHHASEFVEREFRETGEIAMMWICHDQLGRRLVVPPPRLPPGMTYDSPDARDMIADVVRAVFRGQNVTRYVFISEAWLLLADDGPIDQEAVEREGVANQPLRREIVNLMAESYATGLVCARRDIIRPRVGKPRLGPLLIEDRFNQVEGRLASMLPRKGQPS